MFSKLDKAELVVASSLEETPIIPRETQDSSENQAAGVEDGTPAPVEDAGGEEGAGKFCILNVW